MKFSYIFFLTILNGCMSTVTHEFKNLEYIYSIELIVPSGYNRNHQRVKDEKIKRYTYHGGAELYIGETSQSSANYYNILAEYGKEKTELRFQSIELEREIRINLGLPIEEPDTIVYQGVDSSGCYWKDIRIHFMSLGYKGVPKSKKAIFDNAIESIRIVRLDSL